MAKTKEEAVVAHSDGIVVAYVRQGYSVARTLLTKYLATVPTVVPPEEECEGHVTRHAGAR